MLKEETETTIRWDAKDRVATIWTNDAVEQRRLDKLAAKFPGVYVLTNEDEFGKRYSVARKRIRFGSPKASKPKRQA